MTRAIKRFGSMFLAVILVFSLIAQALPVRAEDTAPTSFVYQAENYYSGTIKDGAAIDMQPDETISFTLSDNAAFTAGKYTLSIRSNGNREAFEIKVNGKSVGTVTRSGSDFTWDAMSVSTLDAVLELKPEDVVTIVAPSGSYWGWVDYVQIDAAPAETAYLRYQAENYYSGTIKDGAAIDMQPDETISFTLSDDTAFTAGKYTLSIRSNGNRESFEIKVNGESVGTVTRSGSDFTWDAMSVSSLDTVLELTGSDVVTVVAPSGSYWGWVDYVQLTPVSGDEPALPPEATETGDGYYVYQIEYFYSGNISENVAADMQPNEKIEVALNSNADLAAHTYTLTVKSCGNRTSLEILVNGQSVGTIGRTGTGFGQDQMTEDALTAQLELKPEDVVTVVAPADGYGWVDYMKLTMVHSYTTKDSGTVATPATCTEAQTNYVQCDDCDAVSDSVTVSVGEPAGHNAAHTEGKDATCTEDGNVEYWYCDVCGKYYSDAACTAEITEITVPAGHIDEDANNVCERCGASLCAECVDSDTDKDHNCDTCGQPIGDHSWGEGSVTTEASCTEDGVRTYTCNCGETKTENIPALGHSMTAVPEKKPTPTEGGNNAYYHCETCGKYFKDTEGTTETTVEAETLDKLPATETGEGYYLYQIEYYYSGNISEGVAADMQPNEMIDVALNTNPDFAAGKYTLTVNSCGNRESIEIRVNGESVGTVSRTGTGFGQDQMTADKLSAALELSPEDVITLVAPDGAYGWVDYLKLEPYTEGGQEPEVPTVPDGATETKDNCFVYQAEYYYAGNISEGVAADLQPGETLAFALATNADFTAGTYTLTVYSCGNRESFTVLVNGQSVGTISRTGTGFGQDQMTYDKLMSAPLSLQPGDTLAIVAPGGSYWGWVDFILLDKGDTRNNNSGSNNNNNNTNQTPATSNPTETGDGYYIYQAEAIYTKIPNTGDPAADLQPGESIDFKLSANPDFTAGTYTLSIRSCGNREQFTVKVNGVVIDTVSRTGTEFGMDQMTYDKLMTTLELEPGDTLSIVGQNGEYWGWVDFIILDVGDTTKGEEPEGEATEVGDGYYLYHAEHFYDKVAEGFAADLQPGTVIDIPLNACEGFEAGWYTITVSSCGPRESIYLRLNGKSIGSIARLGTDYGADEMTQDRYKVKVELGPDDVLTLSAPDDGTYGWVDYVRLDAVEPPASAKDDDATEATVPETEPQAEPAEGNGNLLPIVIAVVAVLLVLGIVSAVVSKKKKK